MAIKRALSTGKLSNTVYINSSQSLSENCSIIGVDTTSASVTLTIDESSVQTFIVFDAYEKFETNSCFIVIGLDTFELDKKEKSYEFSYDGSQWNWFETSKKVKT